jgi:hypothetical protein
MYMDCVNLLLPPPPTTHHRRLQTLVTNRKLQDIAAAQAEELAALTAELGRLKARSFPSWDHLPLPPLVSTGMAGSGAAGHGGLLDAAARGAGGVGHSLGSSGSRDTRWKGSPGGSPVPPGKGSPSPLAQASQGSVGREKSSSTLPKIRR